MRYISISLIAILLSCKTSDKTNTPKTTENSNKLTFTLIYEGSNSGFTEKKEQIISNQTDFEQAWSIAFANSSERNPIPQFDFNSKQIVLTTMGEQTSGGYLLKTDSVTKINNEIIINSTALKPGNDCMTTAGTTQPFQFISISKTTKVIKINIKEDSYSCK